MTELCKCSWKSLEVPDCVRIVRSYVICASEAVVHSMLRHLHCTVKYVRVRKWTNCTVWYLQYVTYYSNSLKRLRLRVHCTVLSTVTIITFVGLISWFLLVANKLISAVKGNINHVINKKILISSPWKLVFASRINYLGLVTCMNQLILLLVKSNIIKYCKFNTCR